MRFTGLLLVTGLGLAVPAASAFLAHEQTPSQQPQNPPQRPTPPPGIRIPSASQSTPSVVNDVESGLPLPPSHPLKLLKYNHEEVLKDAEKLKQLTWEIQEEIEKAGQHVLPLATLKKLEEVEKLSKKMRGRLRQ